MGTWGLSAYLKSPITNSEQQPQPPVRFQRLHPPDTLQLAQDLLCSTRGLLVLQLIYFYFTINMLHNEM